MGRSSNALGKSSQRHDWGMLKVRRLAIVTGRGASPPELKAAEMLRDRIRKRTSVKITIAEEGPGASGAISGSGLVVVVGCLETDEIARALLKKFSARLPTLPNSDRCHPEGFAVASGIVEGRPHMIIAGADPRATIYGVGWVLRAITYRPGFIEVPKLDVQDKPAFWLRGGNPSGPGSRARQYGKLRPQTAEEHMEVMEDLMLLGTNVFGGDPALVRSYGMMTTFGRTANEMRAGPGGATEFPKEWGADGGISRKYACPSVPEAREALLESFDEMFRSAPSRDFFTTNSGDEGGCRCERCTPWGGTYIRLVHEIAGILHKYHPDCKVLATNQDLTNEGNQAIFQYLNAQDSSWLYAIRYGPGADEMQTYIRGPVNPKWFEYEGFGPLGNYLKYMHHELPRTTQIALYSDITHWMQAQYAVPRPDVALAAVHGRRSWNARPRALHRVARETLHYAIGDMHYSEGMHDDFNKWFWYRMLWNPHQSAEDISREYCRYWFGPAAQDDMAAAIFLMEETLEKRVLGNRGIPKAVQLLHRARAKIPANLMRADYRWRIIAQKALLDLYIQLKLEGGREIKAKASRCLARACRSQSPSQDVKEAVRVLRRPIETARMKRIKREAIKLGEESNKVIGYRDPAWFIVDGFDLTEVGWWVKVLQEALAMGQGARIRNAAAMVLHYEDPGEGGFYDSLGWPSESAHLVHGESLWGFLPFQGPAMLSHYSLAYSWGRKGEGVTLRYDGLDPGADYVVRVSVGVHWEGREAMGPAKLEQGLSANGQVVCEAFPVPISETVLHEFDLPRGIAKKGKLEIALTGRSRLMPVTGLCEIWVMRKDRMPWTIRP